MSELRSILEDSITRLFDDQVDNASLALVEEQGWPTALWGTIGELGVPQVLVSEDAGGMGGSWADAYVVVRRCGHACVPLPVPESILAGWLAERAGIELPDGAPGLIPHELPAGQIIDAVYNGTAPRIPWESC